MPWHRSCWARAVFYRLAFFTLFVVAVVGLSGCASRSTRPVTETSAPGDKLPVPLFQPGPVYPILARMEGVEGDITVGFIVTTTGDVAAPVILEGESVLLANAALEAVASWKFSPALKSGKPVAVKTVQVINFSLNDAPDAAEQTSARHQVQAPP